MVRQCRYYGNGHFRAHRPVNGPFHNDLLQLKLWETGTYGSYGRRESGYVSSDPQFLVDDFLLTDPGIECPKCKLALNLIKILHGRDKWDASRNGKYFSFNSDIYMPNLSTRKVRLCRFKDTSHDNHNKVLGPRTCQQAPGWDKDMAALHQAAPLRQVIGGRATFCSWIGRCHARSRSTSCYGMRNVPEPRID